VGDDPASQVYVKKKGEMCAALGYGHKDHKLPSNTPQEKLFELVRQLNADDSVDGILVQKPLPSQINERMIFDALDPLKDVDCFSPQNVGLLAQGRGVIAPCTPAGVMEILAHYKINPKGMNALVVGRSDIVGKPMAQLLLKADATVTIAHSRTEDLAAHVAQSNLVVAAIGRPQMMDGDLPWRPDAVVIDVGINRLPSGKLAGDVKYDAVAPKVRAITPVPGGVGPMTIAMLMANTLALAKVRASMETRK
jgi:methylenetetrahydrofolate dehydrogenase (NADP+)/methenyltetrahydrofolate cyclohydrolase